LGEYIVDCQEGRTEFLSFQVGKEEEERLSESLGNSEVSSDQLGTLIEEEDQSFVLIIGGIKIFLLSSPTEASASIAHEEVMHEASEEEAMGPNIFKFNNLFISGA
jgi:hypothetical protein